MVISTALQGAALGVVGECLIVSSNGMKHLNVCKLLCNKY